MFFLAATPATASVDPTTLAMVSIFDGAVVTIIAGFFGAWIQARREHRTWLRKKRYTAYVRFITYERDHGRGRAARSEIRPKSGAGRHSAGAAVSEVHNGPALGAVNGW